MRCVLTWIICTPDCIKGQLSKLDFPGKHSVGIARGLEGFNPPPQLISSTRLVTILKLSWGQIQRSQIALTVLQITDTGCGWNRG